MAQKTWNQLTTELFFEELARQGLQDVFIAPGSRSTPLVLAAAQNKKIKIHTHFDERGLAYFALGCAKKTNVPAAVITTSGTAVSNLLPAVTEAYYGKTPLLILSADRPFELIDVGANQAIRQKNIFQNAVHEFFDIPPANEKTNLENLLSLAGHVFHQSLKQHGPVHLNFQFQEPLAPADKNEISQIPTIAKNYFESSEVYTQFTKTRTVGAEIGFSLARFQKPLVIFGSQDLHNRKDLYLDLAKKLNAPVLCDVQSPVRFENFSQNIFYFDLLLDTFDFDQKPDVILHFGGPITSKRLNQLIERFDGTYVQIHPQAQRLDPLHKQKIVINTTADEFFSFIKNQDIPISPLFELWQKKSTEIGNILNQEFQNHLNEMSLFSHLAKTQANYFVGSSMPIRDLEKFTGPAQGEYHFNRGTSGIDGNIATACGLALSAHFSKNICVLGDQAFLYDMNSLALCKQLPNPLHTIVINNFGGGIFSFLPVKNIDNQDSFQKFFTNPQEWDFKGIALTFGLEYFYIQTPQELQKALESSRSTLIEIKSNIDTNVRTHRELTEKIKKILREQS